MEIKNIKPGFSIKNNFFLLRFKLNGFEFFSFWLYRKNRNYLPILNKKLIFFTSFQDAKNYTSNLKFMQNKSGEKWLFDLSIEKTNLYDLDLLSFYSKKKYVKHTDEKKILTIFYLISDYMFLCEDDILYDYLIENEKIGNLKEKLTDHLLWGKNRDKMIYISKACARLIKEIKDYFETRLLIYPNTDPSQMDETG